MKIAVVGSGAAGLAATWLLNEHSDYTVHLYESDERPGGHANTVQFTPPGSNNREFVNVDTGFIVLNPTTYPNFLRFLKLYASSEKCSTGSDRGNQIRILPTEMTFSVSRDGGAFEWAGKNIYTVFCQPQMWSMIYDIVRFNSCAPKILLDNDNSSTKEISIGEYLKKEGYSAAFRDNYLIPMTAAVWSTPPDKCALDFPARTLIRFMHNHHLLQLFGKPSWLTLQGGSKTYVDRIINSLPASQLHLSTPVISLKSIASDRAVDDHGDHGKKVVLTTANGQSETFDHVILACHSDSAIKILEASADRECDGGITHDEKRILGMFKWNRNEVVLHSDLQLMPRCRQAWSCWNYLTHSAVDGKPLDIGQVSLTYGMNDLQHIPEDKYGPVLVTLNPPFEPRPEMTLARFKYDHPVLDTDAIRAQNQMRTIQNIRGISFAGAYLKYGFHEDAFTSGLLAACSLDPCTAVGVEKCLDRFPAAPTPPQFREVRSPEIGSFIRLPFPLWHAERELYWGRKEECIATLFMLVEKLGIRGIVGAMGTALLWCLGKVFHLVKFDNHPEPSTTKKDD